MKKILFFISNLAGGGAEKVLVNLVNNLDTNKYDITLQTLFDNGINKQNLKKNIHYKSCLKHEFRGWTYLINILPSKFLHKVLIKEKYDIEIAYIQGPVSKIISGDSEKNTKKISWIHNESGYNIKDYPIYSKFDKIVCVAETVKDSFNKTYNLNNNTQTIYNIVESDVIINNAKNNIENFNNKNTFNIISVGSLRPLHKGYDRLARIQKKLLNNGYKTHIYILGTGSEQSKIEKYLTENNISDTWTFLGYKENPYAYVSKADLFVCSSRYEGFSTAVTEALICGVPCISTLVSGAKELLGENNEYGIVTENNEEALFEGIKYLIDNPEKLEYYKKQAEIRGRMFSKNKLIKQHEKLFDNL